MLIKPVLTAIFLTLGILCITCIVSKKRSGNDITRIKVTTKMAGRIIDGNGETIVIDFYISYFKQYRVFELPYHKTYEINNKLIYDSIKYDFFVCNNNKSGYLIKNLVDSFSERISGDSVLTTRAHGGNGWDSVDIFRELKIKTTNKFKVNNERLVYKYTFYNDFYDSAYFYFDQSLKDIKFTFSKPLDSANNSKLNKIELFIKHDNSTTPLALKYFFVNSFEISKSPSENEQQLKNLFERFINQEN